MAFELAGSSNNYLDLLNNLETFANANGWTTKAASEEVASVVIAAAGTGYSPGDTIVAVGGNGVVEVASFNVDAVGAQSATVANGGSGYTNGLQTLTLVGGTFSTAATIDVNVVAGVVDSVVGINNPGSYSVIPFNPVATTGGGGTGADFTLTFGATVAVSILTEGFYHYRAEPNPVATTSLEPGIDATLTLTWQNTATTKAGKRLILEGIGSGSDQIFVGINAIDQGGSQISWDLRGFTGFQDQVDFFSQPGISPGSTLVPLSDGPTTHWFFVNGRRMMMVARMGTSYMNMYLGFINQFGTSIDFPYPLLVGGCSSTSLVVFSASNAGISGMMDPIYHTTAGVPFGPMQIRNPGGQYIVLANSAGALSFRTTERFAGIAPSGEGVTSQTRLNGKTWRDFISHNNTPPIFTYRQTPDSTAASGFRFPLIPCIVYEETPQVAIHGELDGVFWAGTLSELAGQAQPEDVYNTNGDDYILFPNGNRSDHWANFLLKIE
jgi:hypothetical protein